MATSNRLLCFAIALLVLLSVNHVQAQFSWEGPQTGTTTWSAGTWSPGVPPTGGADGLVMTFNQIGTGTFTAINNLGSPFKVAGIDFTSLGGGITVSNAAGNHIEFNNGTEPAFINMPAHGNSVLQRGDGLHMLTLNTPALKIQQSAGSYGSLRINTPLTGSATLEINGATTTHHTNFIDIVNTSSFTGNVILNGGNLRFSGPGTPLGFGQMTINGGSITNSKTAPILTNSILLNDSDLITTGGMFFTNVISEGAVPRGLLHIPTNDDISRGVAFFNANTYSGPTIVGVNPMMSLNEPCWGGLALYNNGSIRNSMYIEMTTGELAIRDSSAWNNIDRINDNAEIRSKGGIISLNGSNLASTLEVVGPINFSGLTSFQINAGATGNTGTTLQASCLNRINRGQVAFGGNNLSFGGPLGPNIGNIIFDSAPALIGGSGEPGTTNISIIPYAHRGEYGSSSPDQDLVTYGPNGVRPLSLAAGEYATSINSGTVSTDNVRMSAPSPVTAPTTINALVVDTTTPFTGSTSTLTLTAGTLLNTAAFTLPATMTLDFDSQEANIFNYAAMTIAGSMTGSNGLTKGGSSTLTFSTTAVVNVTGPLTINEGRIAFANVASLSSFSQIIINGRLGSHNMPGLLLSGATSTQVLNHTIVVNEAFGRIAGVTTAGIFLQIAGQITGEGGIFINGGNVELTNMNNDFHGQFRISGTSNLRFGSDAVFGNAPSINMGSTSSVGVYLTGNWFTSRPIIISASTWYDTAGYDMVMNESITGTGSVIFKVGLGRWEIASSGALGQSVTIGATTTTATININAGELRVTNSTGSATGTATVNINTGSTLSGTGRIAGAVTIAAPSFLEPGLGGSTQGLLSFDGNLTINGSYLVDSNSLGGSDAIYVRGNLTLGAASTIDFKDASNYNPFASYTLATFDGTLSGSFANELNVPAGMSLFYGTNFIALVPEPTSMLGLGVLGLAAWRVHRRLA